MTSAPSIFDRVVADAVAASSGPAGAERVSAWAAVEPALAGVTSGVGALRRCQRPGDPSAGGALAALLRHAADPLAARLVLAAIVPGLAARSAELVRRWGGERAEVDQAMLAAAWEVIGELAGTTTPHAAGTVLGRTRDRVRSALRRQARELGRACPTTAELVDARAERAACTSDGHLHVAIGIRRRSVRQETAALVYATRFFGITPSELAIQTGVSAAAIRMRLARAEAALQAVS